MSEGMLSNDIRESLNIEYTKIDKEFRKHKDEHGCNETNCDIAYDYKNELNDLSNRMCGYD